MTTNVACHPAADAKAGPTLVAAKREQQAAWSSGDYAVVGTTLQIVGESLCEAVDLRSNQRVLDVAAGNGNATLAAARRFAEVVSTDYVSKLLDRGRERAKAERLTVTFQEADAEKLPFADGSFDVVLSTFGVMFTPHQTQAANELVRVCKRGGKVGLANWTPDGFIGRLFAICGKHVPAASGVQSPTLWGNRNHLDGLFGQACSLRVESRSFVMRYRSADHWLHVFRSYCGLVLTTFAALDADGQASLESEIRELIAEFNIARDGTAVIPCEYLEVVVTKRG